MDAENKEIIRGIAKYLGQDLTYSQIKSITDMIDFHFDKTGFYIDTSNIDLDFDMYVISKDKAWDTLRDRLEDLVEDTCDIPNWLKGYINYDQLANDSDRGEEFNCYDGTEGETENYYIYKH